MSSIFNATVRLMSNEIEHFLVFNGMAIHDQEMSEMRDFAEQCTGQRRA